MLVDPCAVPLRRTFGQALVRRQQVGREAWVLRLPGSPEEISVYATEASRHFDQPAAQPAEFLLQADECIDVSADSCFDEGAHPVRVREAQAGQEAALPEQAAVRIAAIDEVVPDVGSRLHAGCDLPHRVRALLGRDEVRVPYSGPVS